MEDVKVVNSFCDVTYDFGIHFALLNVKCMLRYSHLDEACSIMLEYPLFKISMIDIWYFVTKIVLTYCGKKCSSDREKLLKFEAEGRKLQNI